MAGPGYQNVITTDLVDDPMLMANNIKTLKKAYKELYDFAMVRRDNLLLVCVVEWLVLISPSMQNVITHSQKKSEKLKKVMSGHQELAAKDRRISEELTKNIYLRRELDKLKAERTWETWLLKNDLRNLERANFELREQLEGQKKAHQEQLKEQKKAHQDKPFLPSSTST
jgi:hypothetical protein